MPPFITGYLPSLESSDLFNCVPFSISAISPSSLNSTPSGQSSFIRSKILLISSLLKFCSTSRVKFRSHRSHCYAICSTHSQRDGHQAVDVLLTPLLTIRAKLIYKIKNFTHLSPSSSICAMISSICERKFDILATVSFICKFSSFISIFSRVSFGST